MNYSTYILTNKSNKVLYIGVTNNLERRIYEHKSKIIPGFTAKYNLNKLVWFESFANVKDAISAEKKIKDWLRIKKINLIESKNKEWKDLSETDSSFHSE
ncbi:MAG: GIY-YIG nuclease family protein [Candidatus Berkelbacteria bacterium]|nr:GIY-YIG nuclease family protein [Candidatus Berkelbacteria bacterium]